MLGNIHHTSGDIGTVGGATFQIRQQIKPDKPCVNGTAALLQALYMVGAQLLLQAANHLG